MVVSNRKLKQGMTLVEMLIGVVIGLMAVFGTLSLFEVGQKKSAEFLDNYSLLAEQQLLEQTFEKALISDEKIYAFAQRGPTSPVAVQAFFPRTSECGDFSALTAGGAPSVPCLRDTALLIASTNRNIDPSLGVACIGFGKDFSSSKEGDDEKEKDKEGGKGGGSAVILDPETLYMIVDTNNLAFNVATLSTGPHGFDLATPAAGPGVRLPGGLLDLTPGSALALVNHSKSMGYAVTTTGRPQLLPASYGIHKDLDGHDSNKMFLNGIPLPDSCPEINFATDMAKSPPEPLLASGIYAAAIKPVDFGDFLSGTLSPPTESQFRAAFGEAQYTVSKLRLTGIGRAPDLSAGPSSPGVFGIWSCKIDASSHLSCETTGPSEKISNISRASLRLKFKTGLAESASNPNFLSQKIFELKPQNPTSSGGFGLASVQAGASVIPHGGLLGGGDGGETGGGGPPPIIHTLSQACASAPTKCTALITPPGKYLANLAGESTSIQFKDPGYSAMKAADFFEYILAVGNEALGKEKSIGARK